jgi:phosphoribosyl 1,2-cyclic phosphodiesterase
MKTRVASNLSVRFWGVRGSIPSPLTDQMRYGGNTSCVEVRHNEQLLIFDAGSGLRLLGQNLQSRTSTKPIEGTLLLSHAHWDHIQGLPFFTPAYSENNRFRIFSGPGKSTGLQQALRNQMSPPYFPVGFDKLRGLAPMEELHHGSQSLGDFTIRTTELNHPGGCTGFRVETSDGSLGFLPDHEPWAKDAPDGQAHHASLIEFVRGVDVLILDAQYTAGEFHQKIGWGHGCLPDSVQLAIEAGVRRLILFHHDPSRTDNQVDDMVVEARRLAAASDTLIMAASENEPIVIMSDKRVVPRTASSKPAAVLGSGVA